jgi:HemY protein
MLRFIFILFILILSVWLGVFLANNQALTFVVFRDWIIEMPLWFTILSLIIIFLLLFGLLRFFDSIGFSFYRFRNWLRWRRKYKAYSKTNRGLLELIEGQWRKAEYCLLAGIPQSDDAIINYLAAAKAAHEQAEFDKRDNYLQKAYDLAPQSAIPIGLIQAQLQFDQGQLELALATLNRLRALAPKQEQVLLLLKKLYIRLSDWSDLLNLIPSLRKIKSIDMQMLNHLEQNIYKELMTSAGNKKDLEGLHQVWKSLPKKLKRSPLLVNTYVKQLLKFDNASPEVELLIHQTLKKTWDSDLVYTYGKLENVDPKYQLTHAEQWLSIYGPQPVLLLSLGRICIRNLLWGKARYYLEENLKNNPFPETYLEYAKLLERLGEVEQAIQHYHSGLELFANQGSAVEHE